MAIGTGGKRKSQFNTVCQGPHGVKKRPLKWSKKQYEILPPTISDKIFEVLATLIIWM